MQKWMKKFAALLAGLSLAGTTLPSVAAQTSDDNKVDLILDWVPNTNHTGLYVAQAKGYFKEVGVEVDIKRPPEGSTTELVGLGKAAFGIAFQDSLAKRFAGGLPVTAVAAIIEHNTSGIIAKEEAGIKDPKGLEGHKYGTWNDPIELKMMEYMTKKAGGDFSKASLVPNDGDNSIIGLANNQFDAAWVYYAWDGILAGFQKVSTTFFQIRDIAPELDFYSPVIIANNDYLKAHPDQAKKVLAAIKKGYQYAMEHPEEAADILIEAAPELKDQRDFVLASQKWLSERYASDPDKWGQFDPARWNAFYQWLYDNKLVESDLTKGQFFSNDYLGAE